MSPVRLVTLSLALLTLVLFSQVRQFEFINFDDPVYITGNPHVQEGLSLAGLAWAFGQFTAKPASGYRPAEHFKGFLKAASECLALFTGRKPYRESHTNLVTI